jgi:hypothetical protein
MNKDLVGSTYGKFCIRFPQNRMKGEQQSVLAPRHVAVSNIGAYWEMNTTFLKKSFKIPKPKGVIRIRKSKDGQHTSKKDKRANNDLQNIHIKLKIV